MGPTAGPRRRRRRRGEPPRQVRGEVLETGVVRGEPPAGERFDGPAISSSRTDRRGSARAGERRSTRRAPSRWSDCLDRPATARGAPRPGHPAGARGRLPGAVRGDGSGARPGGPLREHQGAPRRLDRALRRRRRDGHAGRAHPGPSRRDAGCRRGRPRTRAAPRGRLDPERPLPGRHAPPRHHDRVAPVRRRTAASPSPPVERTTPTSAATLPGACRPAHGRSPTRAS